MDFCEYHYNTSHYTPKIAFMCDRYGWHVEYSKLISVVVNASREKSVPTNSTWYTLREARFSTQSP